MNKINISKFLKEAKTSTFQSGCRMPMGYTAGLPIISAKCGKVCLKVPFLRYKVTGVVDKTLVFPIKYVLSYSMPNMFPIGFADLDFNVIFRKVDFTKPIGYFRHDAIKTLSKSEYESKRKELMAMYDELANALINNEAFKKEAEFKALLNMLIEPSLKPIYKVLDKEFYNKYLN